VTSNLRYWQAVLRAAEAELDAAATNSDLRIAARKFVRARRQVARLAKHQPEVRIKRSKPAARTQI
jgi:hypothetical protein